MAATKKARAIDTSEKRTVFAEDQLLRAHGYRIHARKRGREAEWELNGEIVAQAEALSRCQEEST